MQNQQTDSMELKAVTDLEQLDQRLLAHGGTRVVRYPGPKPEPHLQMLLERGQLWDGKGAKRRPGAGSQCHKNAALLYARFCLHQTDYDSCDIVVGYGLTPDGLWRQHSWLWADSQIIETTVRRSLYYGVVLSAVEAVQFVFSEVVTLLPGYEEFTSVVDKRLA